MQITPASSQASGAFAQIKEEIEVIIETLFEPDEVTEETTEAEAKLEREMKSAPVGSVVRKLALASLHQLSQDEHVELRFSLYCTNYKLSNVFE